MAIFKNTVLTSTQKLIIFFLSMFTLLIFTQWNLIAQDPLLEYDDDLVVAPMSKVVSLGDYQTKLNTGEILDIQPLRDLSFWLDYQIENLTKRSTHHLHNVLIWFGICLSFFFILKHEEISDSLSMIMVMLYAFHPCLTNAVSWVTARKHLLSELFILLATLIFFKAKKSISFFALFCIIILYFFSTVSQPINVAWPMWIGTYLIIFKNDNQKWNKNYIIMLALLIITMLTMTWINYFYYTTGYLNQTVVSKFVSAEQVGISLKLLSLGASFFQSIIPIMPTAASYYPGTLRNIIGMMLLVPFIFLIYKLRDNKLRKELLLWGVFAILPIIITTIKMTNIFGSDTYLLIPVIGLYIIFAKVFSLFQKYQSVLYTALITLCVVFIYSAHNVSNAWVNSMSLWNYTLANEESPIVLRNLSRAYLMDNNYEQAFKYAAKLIEWNPTMPGGDIAYSVSISNIANMNIDTKILLLKKGLEKIPESAYIKYFLALNYAKMENWQAAWDSVKTIKPVEFGAFKNQTEVATAESAYYCEKAKQTGVDVCVNFYIQNKKIRGAGWSEENFKKRLNELRNEKK